MVYKTKFLKQVVEYDFLPPADGPLTWELTDQPLSAIWITIKGTLVGANMCIDDFLLSLTGIDVWLGSFNVMHYVLPASAAGIKALVMNCKLKQHWPYLIAPSSQTIDDYVGVTFPLLFGAPYLNEQMCLPASLSNRKKLTLTFDVATAAIDLLRVDISEVILPDATPAGCIKQEAMVIPTKGVAEHDLWLQTNWDILKLLIYSPDIPNSARTSTIERAGVEINDFPWGYKNVPWSHLHGEMMDELDGSGNVEDHIHVGDTGMPAGLQHWISNYGEMDFFFEKDLKWRLPTAGASTAKLKYYEGVAHDWDLIAAYYVPASKL